MFQYDNPFFQGVRKLLGLIGLCAVFVVCCLPVFTAGAAFAALYEAVEKNMKHDRGYPFQAFFSSLKENFKRATACHLVILAAAAILWMDIRALRVLSESGRVPTVFPGIFYVLLALLLVWAVWVLAQCVRFDSRAGALLKNGLVLLIAHLPSSAGILAILAGGALIIYLLPASVLVMPGVMVWFISMLTEKVFRFHMTPEQREQYDENNRF